MLGREGEGDGGRNRRGGGGGEIKQLFGMTQGGGVKRGEISDMKGPRTSQPAAAWDSSPALEALF